jgi:hypothetical protein
MTTIRIIAIAALLAFAATATAQRRRAEPPANKKLYCWNQNGHRTCGDTLPPGATDLARTEINASSGMHTGVVGRALTVDERAAAARAGQPAELAGAYVYLASDDATYTSGAILPVTGGKGL